MDKYEYKRIIEQIEKDARGREAAVAIEYAKYHSVADIGDIVISDFCRIKVERVKYSQGFKSLPECVYIGPRLKTNNEPYKKETVENVYQSRVIEVIKQESQND